MLWARRGRWNLPSEVLPSSQGLCLRLLHLWYTGDLRVHSRDPLSLLVSLDAPGGSGKSQPTMHVRNEDLRDRAHLQPTLHELVLAPFSSVDDPSAQF
jgi:hypothetical protein